MFGLEDGRTSREGAALVCRVGDSIVALSLVHVVETMRALPIEALDAQVPGVLGASLVRGAVVPVVSIAALLGAPVRAPRRFVTVAIDGRVAALVVDEVLGVERATDDAAALPPLLSETVGLAALRVLDERLAVVLDAARLVPPDVWRAMEARR